MRKKQIEMIDSYLKPKHIVLEYGAGGSTLYFANKVLKYISIEHDYVWIKKLQNENIPSNVEMHYCPPDNNLKLPVLRANFEDFNQYINYIDKLSYKIYDIVIIDGRARQYCAKKILPYLNDDSIVFCHDFERKRYHEVFKKYYTMIDKEDSFNEQVLAVFKKL